MSDAGDEQIERWAHISNHSATAVQPIWFCFQCLTMVRITRHCPPSLGMAPTYTSKLQTHSTDYTDSAVSPLHLCRSSDRDF